MSDETKAEFIKQPNPLHERVSANANSGAGSAGQIDFAAADQVIADLGKEFVARLPGEMKAIKDAVRALQANPADKALHDGLFRLVHDLKGQAGTFDYMLISVIGNDLCRFLERFTPLTLRGLKVVGFFVDAMQTVTDKRMTGDGHGLGTRMIDTLHRMTQKVLQELD